MKKKYTTPVVEITEFHTEDIITASGITATTLPEAAKPQTLNADDFLYNS